MNIKLSGNIKHFRKEKALTQEQLAEVFGVTTGAVYKWEAGLSIPDLSLLIEMANFFGISVDVLIGYEQYDNREKSIIERIKVLCKADDSSLVSECEKALQMYPHSFGILYTCANAYVMKGISRDDSKLLKRSIDLLFESLQNIYQNDDSKINETTIYRNISEAYFALGDTEKGLEVIQKHNPDGVYDGIIGLELATLKKHDEAEKYLSNSMLSITTAIIRTVTGFLNLYLNKKEYKSGEEVLRFGIASFQGLTKDAPGYAHKLLVFLYVSLAYTLYEQKRLSEARDALVKAKEAAEFFDNTPNYEANSIKFVTVDELVHDSLGETAASSIENLLLQFKCDSLNKLWKEINSQ